MGAVSKALRHPDEVIPLVSTRLSPPRAPHRPRPPAHAEPRPGPAGAAPGGGG